MESENQNHLMINHQNQSLTDLCVCPDLSRNRLSELPLEVCLFVSLEYLNLYQNCLRSLPDGLVNLQALTHLNLRSHTHAHTHPHIAECTHTHTHKRPPTSIQTEDFTCIVKFDVLSHRLHL